VRILLLIALVLGTGCSDERSERCRRVCQTGERCAEDVDDPSYRFDEAECTAACAFLEQDKKGAAIVETYIECVKAAGNDCAAIRRCD
jgi:hypothetical protein